MKPKKNQTIEVSPENAESSRHRYGRTRLQSAWTVVPLVVALLAIVLNSSAASANNFDVLYADSTSHTHIDVGLTADGTVAYDRGVYLLDTKTDMILSEHTSCGLATDICVFDGPYESTGAGGKTAEWWETRAGLKQCDRIASWDNTRCDRAFVYFDEDSMDNFSNDRIKTLGCHEFGHTTGLKHPEDRACMEDPLPTTLKSLGTHNKDHINGKY